MQDLSNKKYQLLKIQFKSQGYLKYMIRFIVGSLILYMSNQIKSNQIFQALNKGEKIKRFKAPAIGLTLMRVNYQEESL